nr:ORF [Nostoc sp.]
MKSTLSRNYPNGGIPNYSKDDIRKDIQFLSTYTDNLKLEGVKELRFELSSELRAKYPDLTSDLFHFETDDGSKKAVIMFQFDKLIIDVEYVEQCVGRGYLQIAKESLNVDKSYLVFVAPFGATSYAEDYIRKRLSSENKGCVGVLTVQELANFLYTQAISSRKLGTAKGEINSGFKHLLTYSFPEPPVVAEQLSIFDTLNETE